MYHVANNLTASQPREENGVSEGWNPGYTFASSPTTEDGGGTDRTPNATSSGLVPLPLDMRFNGDSLISVVAYTLLFVVAAIGNLTVFVTLARGRNRKSRVKRFILHLSIADLIVTFVMLPLEITWHVTVAWLAGDAACRVLMFFRAFGLYLSSFVLITISLDRYFAILHPLQLNDADQRGRVMLLLAWIFSFVASLPQSVIFHIEYHPHFSGFAQCVTFNFFPTPAHELAYNLFNLTTVYLLPLIVIVVAYTLILAEINKKTKEGKQDSRAETVALTDNRMRRSGVGRIQRARNRTLKMTIVIVLVFILCWTPYFVISAWWWFDKDSATEVDAKIQRGLFVFAVSNSCVNPIVYGMFTINFRRGMCDTCCKWLRRGSPGDTVSATMSRSRTQLRGSSISLSTSVSMHGHFVQRKDCLNLTAMPSLRRHTFTNRKAANLKMGGRDGHRGSEIESIEGTLRESLRVANGGQLKGY